MTNREKIVVRILLLVAKWLAPDPWAKEVDALAAHISVHLSEVKHA